MIHTFITSLLITNYSNQTNVFLISLNRETIQLALIISALCIVFGRPLLRKLAYALVIYTGFFFITSFQIQIAYGISAPVNIFFMPIPRLPEWSLSLGFYILYILMISIIALSLKSFLQSTQSRRLEVTKAHD